MVIDILRECEKLKRDIAAYFQSFTKSCGVFIKSREAKTGLTTGLTNSEKSDVDIRRDLNIHSGRVIEAKWLDIGIVDRMKL